MSHSKCLTQNVSVKMSHSKSLPLDVLLKMSQTNVSLKMSQKCLTQNVLKMFQKCLKQMSQSDFFEIF